MKFCPVTVSVNGALPAICEVVLNDVMVGPLTGYALAEEEEVLEFWTVTFCDPADASSATVTVAVSEVAPALVVARDVEPQYTVELATKFVPVTVSVKPVDPATPGVGLSAVMVGPATVNTDAGDVAPPGLCTVRFSFPVEASRLGGIVAVMEFALPPVTANAVAPA
jgi:hypothetical protein